MRTRSVAALLLVAVAALALSGCSGSVEAGPSVPASKVAATAAKGLAAKVGTTPDIDCGSGDIIVVKGKKITCELTDTSGLIYDVAITFTSVKGRTYHIDVKVADTAKNEPTPTAAGNGAVTVPGSDIADLAEQALAPSLTFTPDITCTDAQVPIAVGNTEACTFTDASGAAHNVTVTITQFDGSHYEIDAKVTS